MLLGIGINLAIINIFAVDYKNAYIPKIYSACLAYSFFVLSLTYGNALSEQKRYTEYVIGLVASDLNEIDVDNRSNLSIDVDGSIGHPETLDNLIREYRILGRLIPATFYDNEWDWGSYYFYNYYNLPNMKNSKCEYDKNEMGLIKHTRYYDIYKKENAVLIDLKQ